MYSLIADYNYDDPGEIQRKLERLNQIMSQPEGGGAANNDPTKKMYLSQCEYTYPFLLRQVLG